MGRERVVAREGEGEGGQGSRGVDADGRLRVAPSGAPRGGHHPGVPVTPRGSSSAAFRGGSPVSARGGSPAPGRGGSPGSSRGAPSAAMRGVRVFTPRGATPRRGGFRGGLGGENILESALRTSPPLPTTSPTQRRIASGVGNSSQEAAGGSQHSLGGALAGDISAEVEHVKARLNDAKVRIHNLESTERAQATQIRVLTEQVDRVTKENAGLRAENERLKKFNDELLLKVQSSSSKRARKTRDRLVNSVDRDKLGFLTAVNDRFAVFCRAEVSEVDPFSEEPRRRWDLRGHIVNEGGIVVKSGQNVVPVPPMETVKDASYYVKSFISEEHALRMLATVEMRNAAWQSQYNNEQDRTAIINEAAQNSALITTMKQKLSDTSSARKRFAKDGLYSFLGYSLLPSRVTVSGEDISRKAEQIESARNRLVRTIGESSVLDYAWWRKASLQELRYSSSNDVDSSTAGTGADHATSSERLELFSYSRAVKIFRDFLGGDKEPLHSEGLFDTLEVSITSLARLDAWIASSVHALTMRSHEGLAEEGISRGGTELPRGRSGLQGGRRQSEYSLQYTQNLPLALDQIIGAVRRFVAYWVPNELIIPSTSEDAEERRRAVLEMPREATLVLQIPTTQRMYISVRQEWFTQYISGDVGIVHDCYIAEIVSDCSGVELLGSNANTVAFRPEAVQQEYELEEGDDVRSGGDPSVEVPQPME